jgi:hypothetical protein
MTPRISFPLDLVGREVSFDRASCRSFEGKLIPGQVCKIILPPVICGETLTTICRPALVVPVNVTLQNA